MAGPNFTIDSTRTIVESATLLRQAVVDPLMTGAIDTSVTCHPAAIAQVRLRSKIVITSAQAHIASNLVEMPESCGLQRVNDFPDSEAPPCLVRATKRSPMQDAKIDEN